jgi:hypothetical protein
VAVGRDADADSIDLAKGLVVVGAAEDQGVGVWRRGSAEGVVIDPGAFVGEEAGVVDALLVGGDLDSGVTGAGEDVEGVLAGGYVEEVDFGFVSTAYADAVDKDGTILGESLKVLPSALREGPSISLMSSLCRMLRM